jgi:hypothetical protein
MALQNNIIANSAVAVSPSDTGEIRALALYVGGGGALRVLTASGDDVTLSGVPAGFLLPLEVCRVYSTNTTATNIVALR